jgi:uncharacterized protein YggE
MRAAAALLLAAAALAGTPVSGEPCTSKTGSTVTVQGSATQRVKPDTVAFTVGVETQAADVRGAFDANARKVEAMIAALKQKGVAAEEIQTSNLDIGAVHSEEGRPIGFRVDNLVTVRRSDPASAAELLQVALEAGANQTGSLQFLVADLAATERKGLELAFQDARAKGETLAAVAGRTLGDAICLAEETGQPGRPMQMRALGYAEAAPIEPGTEELRFAVTAVFELR